ncbi:MAG: quaternary ammonium compound efflux SMR transporter SugE [Xanthomonadales bacterium]|nr:quaternary ammonium compound efflux SMR transporter SugE [Xanthomonadales bacterium]
MNWFILFLAGLLEIAWAIGLKHSEGFTKFWPSFWTLITMVASMVLLAIAMKSLPVGTAYAVWVGIGAVGTVVLGVVLFNESADFWRMASVGLIVAGIIGLKLATPG